MHIGTTWHDDTIAAPRDEAKRLFGQELSAFASTLTQYVESDGEWSIRGFIDVFKNVYTISSDTKVVSKILELCLFPHFLQFAESIGYRIELAEKQNWYPDLTFINEADESIKFAVDLKTTYRKENPDICNGFTLGSHGTYFIDRNSTKNIQYPYGQYAGHYCLGIIYSRHVLDKSEETKIYPVDKVADIPSVAGDFVFFATEKWRIASDKGGSGNTANIGSITFIPDIISGNGVFVRASETYPGCVDGEVLFDEYWANYNRAQIRQTDGTLKPVRSLDDFLLLSKNRENASRTIGD